MTKAPKVLAGTLAGEVTPAAELAIRIEQVEERMAEALTRQQNADEAIRALTQQITAAEGTDDELRALILSRQVAEARREAATAALQAATEERRALAGEQEEVRLADLATAYRAGEEQLAALGGTVEELVQQFATNLEGIMDRAVVLLGELGRQHRELKATGKFEADTFNPAGSRTPLLSVRPYEAVSKLVASVMTDRMNQRTARELEAAHEQEEFFRNAGKSMTDAQRARALGFELTPAAVKWSGPWGAQSEQFKRVSISGTEGSDE